jgi:hypothetical protein
MQSSNEKNYRQLYREKNRERIRLYYRKYRLEHKEQMQESARKRNRNRTEKRRLQLRENYLNRAFGPGGALHYARQFAKQKGKCALCGKPPGTGRYGRLHQDHHTDCCPYQYTPEGKRKMLRSCGRCRRGLLCNNCNTTLAGFEDPKWRRKAIAYLKRWSIGDDASNFNNEQQNLF